MLPLSVLMLMFFMLTGVVLNIYYTKKENLLELQNNILKTIKLSKVIHEIQKERGISAGYISSAGLIFKNELNTQRIKTDKAIETLNEKIKPVNIKFLRENIDTQSIDEMTEIEKYTEINTRYIDSIIKITKEHKVYQINHSILAYIELLLLEENVGLQRAVGTIILNSKDNTDAKLTIFKDFMIRQNIYESKFIKYISNEELDYYKEVTNVSSIFEVQRLEEAILNSKTSNISAQSWFKNITKKIDILSNVDALLTENILTTIRNQVGNATNVLVFVIFLNILSVLIFMGVLFLIFILIKREKRLKDIADKYIISSSTDLKGMIIDVSEAFCIISGYSKEELIGKPHNIVRHPDMPKSTFEDLWKLIKEDKHWQGEIKNIRRDGSFYWVDAHIQPIYNDYKNKIGYIAIRHDITSQKEVELFSNTLEYKISEALEKNKIQDQKMLQQSKLASMGEMISMIAHQWRQPLGAISSTSVNLGLKIELEAFDLDTKEGQAEQNSYFAQKLSDIEKYVDNLTTTIDDFRDFYKPNKKVVNIKLEEVVSKALNIIHSSLISDNIEIIQEYNSNQKIQLHDNELMQVVLNILKNAQDNFREKKIKNPKILISTDDSSLYICDNGGGIPEDIIDKIFDPYFSTKDEKNGTGLGLYMSKMIIDAHHNGTLSVQNKDDGVCFIIEIGDISEK
jgi:PAS domain S-box-containing protein